MNDFKTGCLPYKYDPRDYQFKNHKLMDNIESKEKDLLKKDFDLRNKYMPEIYCQKHGSCTVQAAIASYTYQLRKMYGMIELENNKKFSARFTFLLSRYICGNIKKDEGVTIMDACKAIKKYGLAETRLFSNEGDIQEEPDFHTWTSAANEKADAYYQLSTSSKEDLRIEILNALDNDIPVIIGINSYFIRDVDECGLSYRAYNASKDMESTHAVLIVGRLTNFNYYDGEKKNVFVVRNSWGEDWGDKGYIYLPEDEMINCIIKEAAILFKNDLDEDGPNTKYLPSKYGKLNAIPNNSIIYKGKGYAVDYFEYIKAKDINKFKEDYDPIIKHYDKTLIKTPEGNWRDFEYQTIENPTADFPIIYTTKYGQKYIIK